MAGEYPSNRSATGSGSFNLVYQANRSQVTAMFRDANDLVIQMANGSVARIESFFTRIGGAEKTLLLQENDGSLWKALFAQTAGYTVLTGYTSFEPDAAMVENLPSARNILADPDSTWDGYSVEILGYADDVGGEQGEFPAETRTDDATPRLKGVAKGMQPGDQIRIYEGENLLGAAEVDADGNWIFDIPETSSGQHVYTARIVNAAGMESDFSGNLVLYVDFNDSFMLPAWMIVGLGVGTTLGFIAHDGSGKIAPVDPNPVDPTPPNPLAPNDTTAPPAPTIDEDLGDRGAFGVEITTNDTTPDLSGTSEPDAVITVYDKDGNSLGETTADENGNWTWTPTTPLPEGGTELDVTAKDDAGNESGKIPVTVTVDTTAPDQPVVSDITVDGDTTTLTGQGEPGSTITVYDENGQPIHTTPMDVKVDEDGNWTLDIEGLTEGENALTVTATDAAGNESGKTPVTITVDTTAPNTGDGYAITLIGYTDGTDPVTGDFEGGTATNDTTPTLNGTVQGLRAGDLIRIYEGTNLLGTATLDGSGGWTFEVPEVSPDGAYTYKAVIVDAAGNEGISDSITLTVDTTAPSADDGYTITIDDYTDNEDLFTGDFEDGTATNDKTPTLNGTVQGLRAGDHIQIYGGTNLLGTATLDGSGGWTFEVPEVSPDGAYTYKAVIVDAAGNEGISDSITLTVDTIAPSKPEAPVAKDDGANEIPSGGITNDNTPTLSGEGEPGSTVTIKDNGAYIGETSVGEDGTWSWTPTTPLEEGDHSLTTSLTDAAGNTGDESDALKLTVDTTPPANNIITITSVLTDSGFESNDFITNDAAPSIHGSLDTTLQEGEFVQVRLEGRSGEILGWTIVPVIGTNWTLDLGGLPVPLTLVDGSYTVNARIVDNAGNEGDTDSHILTVDTIPPAGTISIDAITEDTGMPGDFVTSDQELIIKGSVTTAPGTGEFVQIRIVDAKTSSVLTDWNNATLTGNNWTLDLGALPIVLAQGGYTIEARLVDLAGNEGNTTSQALVIDTSTPTGYAIVIDTYTDDAELNVGDFGSGTTTNDATPTLNGTTTGTQTGDYVVIYEGNLLLGTATIENDGSWSFELPETSEGSHTYTAKISDAAGNVGTTESAPFILTVDLTPPSGEITIESISDDTGFVGDFTTSDTTLIFSGSVSTELKKDEYLEVRILDASGTSVLDWTETSLNGARLGWTFDATGSPLALGSYTIEARTIDSNGNIGDTATQGLNIVTTVPGSHIGVYINDIATDTPSGLGEQEDPQDNWITRDHDTMILSGTYTGTLDSGSHFLQISLDGGTSWANAVFDPAFQTWSYEWSTPVEGVYTPLFRATDQAGNTAAAPNMTSKEIVVDFTAPDNLAIAPILPEGQDTWIQGDYTTTANTLVFQSLRHGTVEVGTHVGLVWDINHDGIYQEGIDVILDSIKTDANGEWQLDSNFEAGKYHIGFIQWDEAGNYTRLGETMELDVVSMDNAKTAKQMGWSSPSTTYTGSAVTLGVDGLYLIYNNQHAVSGVTNDKATPSSLTKPTGTGAPSHATLADYDRSGYAAIFTNDSLVSDGQLVWTTDSTGSMANILPWNNTGDAPQNGGIIALDVTGDGYLDMIYGNASSPGQDEGGLMLNNGDGTWSLAGGIPLVSGDFITLHRELSGVDLNNDGFIDIVAHIGTIEGSSDSTRLGVLSNQGTGGFVLNQQLDGVFITTDESATTATSMTWADFNGDGFMDLYLNSGSMGTNGNSLIYLNDGNGALNATPGNLGDDLWGGFSLAVDWNQDGFMDIIELSRSTVSSGAFASLHINDGTGNNWTPRTLSSNLKNITGALLVDYNWDGALDLIVTQGGSKSTMYIENTNKPKEGTSLHLRILDQDGINIFYGNTVQLFDSSGKPVSTQIINPQSGVGTNDSTGMVHFYGLNPDETYTVKLFRITDGNESHVTWANLNTTDSSSYVLSAQGGTSTTENKIFTGTGYNDTFIAEAAGTTDIITYNGSGGWTQPITTQSSWIGTGGMDMVDFILAGTTGVTVDLRRTDAQDTGWGTRAFKDIEGLRGGAGKDVFYSSMVNNLFEGRGGDDLFYLGESGSGGNDILLYRMLDAANATGGNGSDTVHGFGLGNVKNHTDADIIDLRELLYHYSGTAYVYWDEENPSDHLTDGKWVLDKASEALLNYLQVTTSGGDTLIHVDLDGKGVYSTLLTLKGIETDLTTLLANNQLLVASSSFPSVTLKDTASIDALTTADTTPTLTGSLPSDMPMDAELVVILNDTSYYSSLDSGLSLDLINHTWSLQVTDPLDIGIYNVTAKIRLGDGTFIGADLTYNELSIIGGSGVSITGATLQEDPGATTSTAASMESGEGNESFDLDGGSHTTLIYRLLKGIEATDSTGGNGHDQVTGFTMGLFEAAPDADRIDLSELLSGSGLNADNSSGDLDAYLNVISDGTNTTIRVDLDGAGTAHAMTDLITLNDVDTDLETLLSNHQLVLY